MTEVLVPQPDDVTPDMPGMLPVDEGMMEGFVTRQEAELLYMPPALHLAACDRTVRFYLEQFGIQVVPHRFFSRLDLLVLASRYEAWREEDSETRRAHWLVPKPS